VFPYGINTFSSNGHPHLSKLRPQSGNPYWRGRLSTIDLLIKVAYFVKKKKNIFIIKKCWSILVSIRRLTVLSLPFGKTSLPQYRTVSASSLKTILRSFFEYALCFSSPQNSFAVNGIIGRLGSLITFCFPGWNDKYSKIKSKAFSLD
jgi:hypothetical protein